MENKELMAGFENFCYVIRHLMMAMEKNEIFGIHQCLTQYYDDCTLYKFCIASPEKFSRYKSEIEFTKDDECVVIYFKQIFLGDRNNYDVTVELFYYQNYGYIKEFLEYLDLDNSSCKIEKGKKMSFDDINSIGDEFISIYKSKPNARILNKKD